MDFNQKLFATDFILIFQNVRPNTNGNASLLAALNELPVFPFIFKQKHNEFTIKFNEMCSMLN